MAELEVLRYALPIFSDHDVSTKISGVKLQPGTKISPTGEWVGGDDRWVSFERDGQTVWLVAESDGNLYAAPPEAPGTSPDDGGARWRRELFTEQSGQPWVAEATRLARSHIDRGATKLQEAAAEHMISILGIQERPNGSNRGPALSGIVGEYVEHHRISNDKSGTGLAWCALVAQWAQAEAMGLKWATPASWSAHPLGNWYGAAWMQEREAKRKGLWVPCASLKGTEVLTGALLVQIRGGSGSDAASGGVRADGSYAGHVDLVLGWKDKDHLWCVGGNLGNTAKLVTRNIREARCRGLVPLKGA